MGNNLGREAGVGAANAVREGIERAAGGAVAAAVATSQAVEMATENIVRATRNMRIGMLGLGCSLVICSLVQAGNTVSQAVGLTAIVVISYKVFQQQEQAAQQAVQAPQEQVQVARQQTQATQQEIYAQGLKERRLDLNRAVINAMKAEANGTRHLDYRKNLFQQVANFDGREDMIGCKTRTEDIGFWFGFEISVFQRNPAGNWTWNVVFQNNSTMARNSGTVRYLGCNSNPAVPS
jgi:hypothetical protein